MLQHQDWEGGLKKEGEGCERLGQQVLDFWTLTRGDFRDGFVLIFARLRMGIGRELEKCFDLVRMSC